MLSQTWLTRMACCLEVKHPLFHCIIELRVLMSGHNCVWYNQLPSWVTANNYSAPELSYIVANRCETLVGHYKGQVFVQNLLLTTQWLTMGALGVRETFS